MVRSNREWNCAWFSSHPVVGTLDFPVPDIPVRSTRFILDPHRRRLHVERNSELRRRSTSCQAPVSLGINIVTRYYRVRDPVLRGQLRLLNAAERLEDLRLDQGQRPVPDLLPLDTGGPEDVELVDYR